jgi:RNA polymerase sigma factor
MYLIFLCYDFEYRYKEYCDMREIDVNAMRAKNDGVYMEEFIKEYELFILHTAHKCTGRYVTKMDDHWSVALNAFHEAVRSYDFDKGAFLPFADTVIRRRLYDHNRKESRHNCEILIDSYTIEHELEEGEPSVKYEVMAKTAMTQKSDAKLEIGAISETLKAYGISFMELAEASPKAAKTKAACAEAVRYLVRNTLLLNEMRRTRNLPLKIIEKNCSLPRKVLERHRKYIIAGSEIMAGDYPVLSEYLRFMREEEPK